MMYHSDELVIKRRGGLHEWVVVRKGGEEGRVDIRQVGLNSLS
jgi:hypothetical protein